MKPNRKISPYLFLAPAVLIFSFAILVPIVMTFYYSFFNWNGFGEMSFSGLSNYWRAFNDTVYLLSYKNIFIYIVLTIVLEVVVGLIFAGLITVPVKGTSIFRVAFFTPVMLPLVIVSFLWIFVYNADFGLINSFLAMVGLDQFAMVWLGNTKTALISISIVSGWVFAGFYMTIFYAGFIRIPVDIYEAAQLDGVNQWQLFTRIKVPLIFNIIEITILICIMGAFQGFDLFYVMTNGGPYHATEIVTTYLVKVVFQHANVGYGAALAVIMSIVVLLIGILFQLVKRKSGNTEY